eukprot:1524992-Rhodomonas_salina.1
MRLVSELVISPAPFSRPRSSQANSLAAHPPRSECQRTSAGAEACPGPCHAGTTSECQCDDSAPR